MIVLTTHCLVDKHDCLPLQQKSETLRKCSAEANLAKAAVLTKPLSDHMDHLSLLETVQNRERLQNRGILSENSKAIPTIDDLCEHNLEIITGNAGNHVICQFFDLLENQPAELFLPEFGIERQDCFCMIMSAICDTWRRMVLPFTGNPWQIFKIVGMNEQEGLAFTQQLALSCCSCHSCEDEFFTKVSWLRVAG